MVKLHVARLSEVIFVLSQSEYLRAVRRCGHNQACDSSCRVQSEALVFALCNLDTSRGKTGLYFCDSAAFGLQNAGPHM